MIESVAEDRVGFGVVVRIAVGTGCVVDLAVELGAGVTVVVGAHADVLLDHLVAGLQRPHTVLPAAAEPGLRALWQLYVELVTALAIEKLDDVDAQAFVAGEAIPDAHLGQQPADEGQVAFAVLHDVFAPGVVALEVEQEVLAFETVAGAQDVFDDFGHGLVLVDAQLSAACEQSETGLQGEYVGGLVVGAGLAGEGGDDAVQHTQGVDLGWRHAQQRQFLRWSVQAEAGCFAQQGVDGEVEVGAGELHAVAKGLAELFCALEGQDVKLRCNVANPHCVPAVIEENTHLQASMTAV